MKLPMKMHINSIKAVLNVCLSVKMFKNMARVVFFKHFSGQEHIFNKAFVRVLGFSSSSFMTLVVVRPFFCNMIVKKTLIRTQLLSFSASGNSWCESRKHLRIPTQVHATLARPRAL